MNRFMIVCALVFSGTAFGQSVDVKGLDTQGDGTTTIKIEKNVKAEEKKSEIKFETSEGNAEVEGEPAASTKEARAAWTTACTAWKKEIRADNKHVLAISCGRPNCGGEAGAKTCTSQATYKIKTRLDE